MLFFWLLWTVKQPTQAFKYPCFLRVCVPQWFRWGWYFILAVNLTGSRTNEEKLLLLLWGVSLVRWVKVGRQLQMRAVPSDWSPGKRWCKKETFACLPSLLCASPPTLLVLLRLHSFAGIITQLLKDAYVDFQWLSRNTPGLRHQTARLELLGQSCAQTATGFSTFHGWITQTISRNPS